MRWDYLGQRFSVGLRGFTQFFGGGAPSSEGAVRSMRSSPFPQGQTAAIYTLFSWARTACLARCRQQIAGKCRRAPLLLFISASLADPTSAARRILEVARSRLVCISLGRTCPHFRPPLRPADCDCALFVTLKCRFAMSGSRLIGCGHLTKAIQGCRNRVGGEFEWTRDTRERDGQKSCRDKRRCPGVRYRCVFLVRNTKQ